MISCDNGEAMSDSDSDEMPELEDASDGDWVEYPLVGEILFTRHPLSTQIKVMAWSSKGRTSFVLGDMFTTRCVV